MALNQLQYMSLSMSVIKFDDIKQRLQSSSKDEDISPFTAVDKYVSHQSLFSFLNTNIVFLYSSFCSSYAICIWIVFLPHFCLLSEVLISLIDWFLIH